MIRFSNTETGDIFTDIASITNAIAPPICSGDPVKTSIDEPENGDPNNTDGVISISVNHADINMNDLDTFIATARTSTLNKPSAKKVDKTDKVLIPTNWTMPSAYGPFDGDDDEDFVDSED